MNINKKIITISVISLLLIAIILHIYFTKYSKDAKLGQLNWQRIEQVEIGMSIDEVNKIMNEPDTIYFIDNDRFWNNKRKIFGYYRGPGIYGYLQVIIDPSADTVVQVVNIME